MIDETGIGRGWHWTLESSQGLSALIHDSPFAYIEIDSELRIRTWNPAATVLFGYAPLEALGRSVEELLFSSKGEGGATVSGLSLFGNSRAGGARTVIESRTKSGSSIVCEWYPTLLRDRTGQIMGLAILARDITELKRAEDLLRSNEQRLRRIVENLPAGALVCEGGRLFLNKAAEIITGYDRTELITFEEMIQKLVPSQDERRRLLLQRDDADLFHRPCVFSIRRKDGASRIVEATGVHDESTEIWLLRDVTENRRAEEERDRFFNLSLDILCIANLEGYFTRANPAFERILGFTVEEMTSRPFFDYVHPDDQMKTRLELENLGKGFDTIQFENRYRSKDGSYRWLAWRCPGATPDSHQVYAVARDVTAQKIQEEALTLQALVLERMAEGVSLVDTGGRIHFTNRAQNVMYGYERDELIGCDFFALTNFSPEEIVAIRSEISARVGEHGEWSGEFISRHRSGRLFPTLKHITGLERDGRMHWVCVSEDISVRKKAEEALRESEERWQLALAANNDGIWDWDLRNNRVYFSPRWKSMIGFDEHEIRDHVDEWRDRVHPEDLPRALAMVDDYLKGRVEQYQVEFRMEHREGGYRWILARGVAVRDRHHVPYRMVGSHTDITQRKNDEESIRQALNAADAASKAKSDFLSRMSHELRTPLNAILGFGQILQIEELKGAQKECVDHIVKAGRHLLGLINEVLDMSRIEAGHLPLTLEPLILSEAIQEAAQLLEPLAKEKQIVVRLSPPQAQDDAVFADRQRLKQVLLNILGNSLKYTPQGGDVILSWGVMGQYWNLDIADTGLGIPADKMSRLFTPFDRLGAEKGPVEGSGLGLALAKRIVEAMKGKLLVASQVGRGTTVTILLPKSNLSNSIESSTQAEATSSIRSINQPVGTAGSVLVIEDQLANVQLLQQMLKMRPGIKLLTAMQGSVGLDLAKQQLPDLILLDVHLPDISGQEVLRRLRAEKSTRAIPVVVLTADASPDLARYFRDLGAADFSTKPLDLGWFLKTIDRHLLRKPANQPSL